MTHILNNQGMCSKARGRSFIAKYYSGQNSSSTTRQRCNLGRLLILPKPQFLHLQNTTKYYSNIYLICNYADNVFKGFSTLLSTVLRNGLVAIIAFIFWYCNDVLIVILKYNLYNTKFTCRKCIMQWFLVYLQLCNHHHNLG